MLKLLNMLKYKSAKSQNAILQKKIQNKQKVQIMQKLLNCKITKITTYAKLRNCKIAKILKMQNLQHMQHCKTCKTTFKRETTKNNTTFKREATRRWAAAGGGTRQSWDENVQRLLLKGRQQNKSKDYF